MPLFSPLLASPYLSISLLLTSTLFASHGLSASLRLSLRKFTSPSLSSSPCLASSSLFPPVFDSPRLVILFASPRLYAYLHLASTFIASSLFTSNLRHCYRLFSPLSFSYHKTSRFPLPRVVFSLPLFPPPRHSSRLPLTLRLYSHLFSHRFISLQFTSFICLFPPLFDSPCLSACPYLS